MLQPQASTYPLPITYISLEAHIKVFMNKFLLISLFASTLIQTGETPVENGTNVKIEIYRAHEDGHYFAGTHTITSTTDLLLREVADKMKQNCNEDGDLIILANARQTRAVIRVRTTGRRINYPNNRTIVTHSSQPVSRAGHHKMIFCTKEKVRYRHWHAD